MPSFEPLAPLPKIPRVESLLEQMTLAEKIGQMIQHPWGHGDPKVIDERTRKGEIGSFLNALTLADRNHLQRIAVEESRLKIPLIFGRDVIHGYRTIFPIPLGQAASFNPQLVEDAAQVAAREAREAGIDWTFAPMVDVSRDGRWGRIAESCGEDPYLAGELGAAMVRGFQGKDPAADPNRIAACAKHYVGYGATEGGRDYNTASIDERSLRDVYLAPFKACVEAGALTLMSAFNELNGVPASGNVFTIRQVLKREWGFEGAVVSDWTSLPEMIHHGFCADNREVALEGCLAGVDLEMASLTYWDFLPSLIEQGKVPLSFIDDAVRRLLIVKHRMGLFERPYVETPKVSTWMNQEHRALAHRAVLESAVLLKNDAGALPLSPKLGKLAVIGPMANDAENQLGCWAPDHKNEDGVTPLQALRERLGEARVAYAPGLESSRSTETTGFAAALDAARSADAIVAFLGEEAVLSGEAHCRAFIELPGAQNALVEALSALGKPLVLVIIAGRPLTLGSVAGRASAVLYAWHPGTMAGPGLADLLLGEVSPSGKLPVSFPRTVGQIPVYYNYKNTGRPPAPGAKGIPLGTPLDPIDFTASYLDVEVTPEYAFGFGLSYTKFEYSDIVVSKTKARIGETLEVSAKLKNTGNKKADEVVQLYVRDLVGSATRPVRELKAFERVTLGPGEEKRVSFQLSEKSLSFCRRDMSFGAEPGNFHVWIGGSSEATLKAEFELIA
jgi:beta-glucosidase